MAELKGKIIIHERATQQERLGFQPGTIGVYSPGALGVSIAHHLGINHFITSEVGRSARLLPSKVSLNVVDGFESKPIEAIVSHGLVKAYEENQLPEVILACPNADKVPRLVEEIINLTYAFVDSGALCMVGGKLQGLENLPTVVLASNGILDEITRTQLSQAISSCVENKQIEESLTKAWLGKTVRGLSFISGEREGMGEKAIYKPSKKGAVVLCGGEDESRKRIFDLTVGKESIRFIDGKEKTQEKEWRKAYTNLMTNVVGLTLSVDKRKNSIRLDIPVGRILTRMKPGNDQQTYIEVEGSFKQCTELGEIFFNIAKAKGLFQEFSTWKEFNQKIFLEPLKDTSDFYAHVPSSLQKVANQVKAGILSDEIPPNEGAILGPLIIEANNFCLDSEVKTLKKIERSIIDNIRIIKEEFRKPQVHGNDNRVIKKIFNQTGEIAYIAFNPDNLGLTKEQIDPYKTKSRDVIWAKNEVIVPMTAEVFSYGPEHIPGNVAFITNGAGFTLEALDRCTDAGIRLGFISDLRLKFEEGKYYLAMKMALAANTNIDTIAIDVFTTLGTGSDVAKAIQRISEERPDLKFVVKMEAREQQKGFEILQQLRMNGIKIIFTENENVELQQEVTPLTIDQMIKRLRSLEGLEIDKSYKKYENFAENELKNILSSTLNLRVRHLLLPTDLIPDNVEEINLLRVNKMLSVESVFGKNFLPAKGTEKFSGRPVVVIVGYGVTARLQASLMRKAGTEVVLLHPKAKDKIKPDEIKRLSELGISIFSDAVELEADLKNHYSESVDIVGLCYEPYSPEIGEGETYSERIEEAVGSLIKLKTKLGLSILSLLIPTEMVPTTATKSILAKCKQAGIWLIGPNSPGMSRSSPEAHPSQLKIAQIPMQCILPGEVAVAGVGGTMLFETLADLKRNGVGTSWAISLGGDRTRGLSGRDATLIAENDPNTKYIVYIGEPGGFAAQELAEVMNAGLITKPVIVKILGSRLPDDCHIGHAGAVVRGADFERTQVKIDSLLSAGAIVVHTSEQMVQAISSLRENPQFGPIDVHSSQFMTARQVMGNLIQAQESVIKGITD
ncbi:MAG: hypothetical protein AUJ41_04560 [Candidatus Pacebacteria bacterium CG1_02_43_31]|nr:MAG: hypothetical protein AUJ41_04560 [Candidatus Pacebacteria bacterium CG1_02_43_31]